MEFITKAEDRLVSNQGSSELSNVILPYEAMGQAPERAVVPFWNVMLVAPPAMSQIRCINILFPDEDATTVLSPDDENDIGDVRISPFLGYRIISYLILRAVIRP